ncbi:MAG: ParB N-terminal domain-containing protein [Thaumarchaeota archaeon]|nr:ParB N-terminal domain-containing protein [Nitrososphaerota archaeon]
MKAVGEVVSIPVSDLEVNPWNCNVMSEAQMRLLIETVKRSGPEKMQPVIVRSQQSGKMQIIDGEHRFLAAKEHGWEAVPAIIVDLDDEQAKVMCIKMNYLRGKLDPMRLFDVFYEDWDGGNGKLTTRQLEEKFDHLFDQSWIVRILQLRNLSPEVKKEAQSLFNGESEPSIGLKHLIAIAQLKNEEKQTHFLKAALSTGVSASTLDRMIREYQLSQQQPSPQAWESTEDSQEAEFSKSGGRRSRSTLTESIFRCEVCHSQHRVNWRRRTVSRIIEEADKKRAVYVPLVEG